MKQTCYRISDLRDSLRCTAKSGELEELFVHLDNWSKPEDMEQMFEQFGSHNVGEVQRFLASLRPVADEFAKTSVDIDFIIQQIHGRNGNGKVKQT